ncbi:helix-turn-helix transcriptional regulator [Defluviimonas salinarum]|uniref:AlpA family phage regulatory protein n=1 Tax=Defluviimonas salinarum TaxID=2992147 RepID=A0ABT3IXX9_9RHOB|nr:AlpA family phage regulatory protein [Defluviimonas salinarum]MCW3780267.1 AlpA family phage regulatory protein [Defluviimonas salinarum]
MTYISDKQIAERWGVHRVTPWRLAKSVEGFPQPVKLSANVTRWKLADIEAWEKAKAEVKA